jgi:hypothetical protein
MADLKAIAVHASVIFGHVYPCGTMVVTRHSQLRNGSKSQFLAQCAATQPMRAARYKIKMCTPESEFEQPTKQLAEFDQLHLCARMPAI